MHLNTVAVANGSAAVITYLLFQRFFFSVLSPALFNSM